MNLRLTLTRTVDAYPEETFTGTVRLISRSAVTEDNVIYYTVYVDVANPEGKLLPTMTARTNGKDEYYYSAAG